MRILVTGATGFIGGAFVRAARGSHDVAALVRPSTVLRSVPGAGSIVGSLRDPNWREIDRFAPDALVHLAWVTTPGEYLDSPTNLEWRDASIALVEGAVSRGVRHVVGVGTCIEYAPSPEPLRETSPVGPSTLYARCKDEMRRRIESLEVDACWARVFFPYGRGEHPARLLSAMVPRIARGEKVELKTPSAVRDYVHVDDVARALLAAVERRATGPLNVGSGHGIEIRALVCALGEVLGVEVDVASPRNPEPLDRIVADVAQLRSLGWQPQVPLATGLRLLSESVVSPATRTPHHV